MNSARIIALHCMCAYNLTFVCTLMVAAGFLEEQNETTDKKL